MKDEEIKAAEEKIKALHETIIDDAKKQLESSQVLINNKIKEAIETYSNNVKNLGIVSGTVAPFSLSLLAISELNIYPPFLLAGFYARRYCARSPQRYSGAKSRWILPF